jgi:hypothetical protein
MAIDRTRTLRGALAGGVAAAVWAAAAPLDARLFGVRCDDVELLGTLAGGSRAAGLAMHVGNGAAFGAGYAAIARPLPGPGWLRGAAVALAEHVATWPAAVVLARRGRLDAEWETRAAFAQSAWRHLLFGALLGGLEARLNPAGPEPVDETAAASNGHGSVEHLVATGPAVL